MGSYSWHIYREQVRRNMRSLEIIEHIKYTSASMKGYRLRNVFIFNEAEHDIKKSPEHQHMKSLFP